MKIRRLHNTDEVDIIQKLAKEIWPVSYGQLLSPGQIKYMLKKMYSAEELSHQINNSKYCFLLLEDNNAPVGFAVASPKNEKNLETWHLHKLYVLPTAHGSGFGKALLNKVSELARQDGAHTLELNVNKQNPAINFYKAQGFSIAEALVNDIGNGYVMDDYIMSKSL